MSGTGWTTPVRTVQVRSSRQMLIRAAAWSPIPARRCDHRRGHANRYHYELAAKALAQADPGWLADLITRQVPLDQWGGRLRP